MPTAVTNLRLERRAGRTFRVNWDAPVGASRYAVVMRSRNIETGAIEPFTGQPSDRTYADNWRSPYRTTGAMPDAFTVVTVAVTAYGTSQSDASPTVTALAVIPPSSWDPEWRLEFAWDGSTWTDETARYEALDAVMRLDRDALGNPTAGSLRLVLDNWDERYSPSNDASPIAGQVKAGRLVRVTVRNGSQTIPVWYGRLRSFTIQKRDRKANIECIGLMPVRSPVETGILSQRNIGQLTATLSDLVDGPEVITYGKPTLIPVWWHDGGVHGALRTLNAAGQGLDAYGDLDGAIAETQAGHVRVDGPGAFDALVRQQLPVAREDVRAEDRSLINRIGGRFPQPLEQQPNSYFPVVPQPTPTSDIPTPASVSFEDSAASTVSATTRRWNPVPALPVPSSWVVGGGVKTITAVTASTAGFVTFSMTGAAELRPELEPLLEITFSSAKGSVTVRGNYDLNTASSVSWNAEGYEAELDAWLAANSLGEDVTITIRIPEEQPYVQAFPVGTGWRVYWEPRAGSITQPRLYVFQFYAQPMDRTTFGSFIVDREDEATVDDEDSPFHGMRLNAWQNSRARAFQRTSRGGSATPVGIRSRYWSTTPMLAGFYLRDDIAAPSASQVDEYNREIVAVLGSAYAYRGQFTESDVRFIGNGMFVYEPFGVDTGNGVFVAVVTATSAAPRQQADTSIRYADVFIARQDMTQREAERFIVPGYDNRIRSDDDSITAYGEERVSLGIVPRPDGPVDADTAQALVDLILEHRKDPRYGREITLNPVTVDRAWPLMLGLNDPYEDELGRFRIREWRLSLVPHEGIRDLVLGVVQARAED